MHRWVTPSGRTIRSHYFVGLIWKYYRGKLAQWLTHKGDFMLNKDAKRWKHELESNK